MWQMCKIHSKSLACSAPVVECFSAHLQVVTAEQRSRKSLQYAIQLYCSLCSVYDNCYTALMTLHTDGVTTAQQATTSHDDVLNGFTPTP